MAGPEQCDLIAKQDHPLKLVVRSSPAAQLPAHRLKTLTLA